MGIAGLIVFQQEIGTMKRRGAALFMVIMLIVVALITSLSLYNSVYILFKMQGVAEVNRVKEYYIAVAGSRYGLLLLRDPGRYGITLPDTVGDTHAVTKSLKSDYLSVWNDLGLKGSQDVTIKITKTADNQYDLSSKYSY